MSGVGGGDGDGSGGGGIGVGGGGGGGGGHKREASLSSKGGQAPGQSEQRAQGAASMWQARG